MQANADKQTDNVSNVESSFCINIIITIFRCYSIIFFKLQACCLSKTSPFQKNP